MLERQGAVVFGGASGLGEATARRLHELGAAVTVADVSRDRGEALATELGERASFVAADVTDAEQVAAAVKVAREADSGLRVAVCCAGIGYPQRIASPRRGPHDLGAFEKTISVSLTGTFNGLRLAADAMLGNDPGPDGDRGVVVMTSSIAAYDSPTGEAAYAAAKAGIVAMTLVAARDLGRNGVRVCSIAPGAFKTGMTELTGEKALEQMLGQIPFPKRMGRPAEFAALVEQIVANPMLNGETIRLDAGLRVGALSE